MPHERELPDDSSYQEWMRLHPGEPRPTSPRPPGNADSNRIVVEALAAAKQWQEDTAKDPDSWGKDGGLPAYPVECYFPEKDGSIRGLQTGNHSGWETGLTKREYFAGQALVGFQQFVRGGWCGVMDEQMANDMAANCFAIADAMIRRTAK